MNRIEALVIAGLLGCVVMCLPIAAQVSGGSISGIVSDPSGAVVPNAEIKVRNLATGIERDLDTDGVGFYSVPNLSPGNYDITVSFKGFRTMKQNALVTVGAELAVNIRLELGSETEVTVHDEAPAIDTASSSLNATVGGQAVRELPLNGRDWTMLATLNPGVHTVDTQSSVSLGSNARGNRGWGTTLNVGGTRPQANNYRLDGIVVNDYSGSGPGSVLGLMLGVDAIQEFSVITGNAPAPYGRVSGGVINAVTRAGTNQFHGSVYEFVRNSAFDARNFYDAASAPPFRRNQFGGSAGGPIAKNHTFFFFDYEGLRQSLSLTSVVSVPSLAAHNGQLAAGAVTVNPKVVPYLALFPLPNGPVTGDTGIYTFVDKNISPDNLYTARVDHQLSASDTLHGTFQTDGSTTTGPDAYDFIVQEMLSSRKFGSLEESHIFGPSLANFARAGYSRSVSIAPGTAAAVNPLANDTSLGFVPGAPVGVITISGITTFGGGVNAQGTYTFHYNSYQLYDDLFYTRGAHSLKFGGGVEYIQSNDFGSLTLGNFTFGSWKNFLTNSASSFTSMVPGATLPIDGRQTVAAGYAADDWRARPNLTLNLGLRYEVASVPSERHDRITNLPTLTSSQPRLGAPFFNNPTRRNFSPRVGFAWNPFPDGKTVVRGGFGIYDTLPLTSMFNLTVLNAAPYNLSGNVTSNLAGTFPGGAFPLITPQVQKYAYVQSDPGRMYVLQWNLTVQRELLWKLILSAGYNGSHGVHQPFRVNDANIVLPSVATNGTLNWPTPAGSGARLNPNVGTVDGTAWETSSKYNALNLSLSRQFKGLRLGAAYTWSRSLDDSSSSGSNSTNSIQSEFILLPWLFRGLSDFNVSHLLVGSYLWQLPEPHSQGLLGKVAGGWQFGGIIRFSDGLPFTPVIGGDPMGLKDSNTFGLPDRLTGPGCSAAVNSGNPAHYIKTECFTFPNPATRLGNSGRNVLIGPGVENVDFSLYKNIQVLPSSERLKLQFRAELFNILNHANFGTPNRTSAQVFNVNGALLTNAGLLTATSTTSRQIQLALKFMW